MIFQNQQMILKRWVKGTAREYIGRMGTRGVHLHIWLVLVRCEDRLETCQSPARTYFIFVDLGDARCSRERGGVRTPDTRGGRYRGSSLRRAPPPPKTTLGP